jgi:gas vesicle protein
MNNLIINEPNNSTLEIPSIHLANAATQRPGNSSYCQQLLQDIKVLSQGGGRVDPSKYGPYFINENDPTQTFNGVITKSISQRFVDLIVDKNDLSNIRRTGKDSYSGHQTYLRNQLKALSAAVSEFKENCSENGLTAVQEKILGQGRIAIKTPVPLAPDAQLRELTKPGNSNLFKAIEVIKDILTKAGVAAGEVLTAIAAGLAAIILAPNIGQQFVQKDLDNLLTQLSKDQSVESATSSLQKDQPDKPIDRSTASAEELLENAYKVAARLQESGRGESPEFKELMKQLNEQKRNLEELNQVADPSKSNQSQREIG